MQSEMKIWSMRHVIVRLNRHHHFDPHQHIIEWPLQRRRLNELMDMSAAIVALLIFTDSCGGTAAAVSLGQAAALAVMVCDLTLEKEMGRGMANRRTCAGSAIPMLNRAGVLASEDSDAFDAVMDSFASQNHG